MIAQLFISSRSPETFRNIFPSRFDKLIKMKSSLIVCLFFLFCVRCTSQLLINEIQVTNYETFMDEQQEFGDWIELFNAGSEAVLLNDFALSDDPTNLLKWILPDTELAPAEHIILFASDKNRYGIEGTPQHYEIPIYPWNIWSYLVPTEEPDASWRFTGYDDFLWDQNTGGIGFGDGDDATEISWPATSLYTRTSFYLSDVSSIELMYLAMDYDDAFVAYLNGVEIARANIGIQGVPPGFQDLAVVEHEANGYQDLPFDFFGFTADMLAAILLPGENVLAIQTHNVDPLSSDLTSNALLILGMNDFEIQTEMAPEWIDIPTSNNHTNFKLNVGEILSLTNTINESTASVLIPDMQMDDSYQRSGDGNVDWCVSQSPSPGISNNTNCYAGYAQKPIFLTESGMYNDPVSVVIESVEQDAQIYYSLDGSIPDSNDYLYTGPFVLDTTATVSAVCFLGDFLPSPVEKNTFMFNEWGVSLPVISLSTNPENLWDPVTGIHVLGPDYESYVPYFGANFWEDWERPAYVEYFDVDHELEAEGPVGLKIHGGYSRSMPQKSFRVQCKDEFGMQSIDYPLINDKSFIQSYHGFNLRNGGNDYQNYRFHDALMQRAFKGTHADYMAYTPVVVFLNGEYWGFMEMREILDQDWVEANKGIAKSDATVVSMNYMGFNVISGNDSTFYPMYQYVVDNDPNDVNYLDSLSALLDIENYIDYIIAETYWANGDWSNGWINNTKLWHDDRPGGKWRFLLMDLDFGMGLSGASPYDDYITTAEDEDYFSDVMFSRISQNPAFRVQFINRYADLINTNLQPNKIAELAFGMRQEIVEDFPRHCEMWWTNCDANEQVLADRLEWNNLRVQGARDVVESHYELEGQVDITLNVFPAGAGRIHISTIEPLEEEYPWTGVYFKGVPVVLTVVSNPGFVFDHWAQNTFFPEFSNLEEVELLFTNDEVFTAYFTGTPTSNAVVVSEFMYHDHPNADSGDWIEVHNLLNVPLDLSGYYIKDSDYFNRFDMPLNTTIPANGFMIFGSDQSLFANEYPELELAGEFDFSLSNNSDMIRLFDPHGINIIGIHYDDELPWPANTDGTSRSVEFLMDYTDQGNPSFWTNGCIDGSPYGAYDANCGSVQVSAQNESSRLQIYPVPAAGNLFVVVPQSLLTGICSLQLMDASGKIVLAAQIKTTTTELNTYELSNGAYFVRVRHDKGVLNDIVLIH